MYDHINYLEDIAEKLKEILHTSADRKFFRISGVANLEELLQNNSVSGMVIVADDNVEGSLIDKDSDNVLDNPYYSFLVLKQVSDPLSMSERHTVLSDSKAVVKKIFSKMFKDKRDRANGLDNLERDNIKYFTVGPVGMQWYGVQVGFTLLETLGAKYNTADWEE